jgi:glycosyltransferase involved in cell wall biosynthesis
MSILAVGCGRKPVPAGTVGIDVNVAYAIAARRTSPPNSLIAVADARALPFRTAAFAECVCWEVLEHIEEKGSVVQECRRVLSTGGVLTLSTPLLGIERALARLSKNYRSSVLETQHRHCVTAADTLSLTERYFHVDTIWFAPKDFAYCLGAAFVLDRYHVTFDDTGALVGACAREVDRLARRFSRLTWWLFAFVNRVCPGSATKSICLRGRRRESMPAPLDSSTEGGHRRVSHLRPKGRAPSVGRPPGSGFGRIRPWAVRLLVAGLKRLRARGRLPHPRGVRRVVHLSLNSFEDGSLIGGGERFAENVAAGMSACVEAVFICFGATRSSSIRRGVRFEVLEPGERFGTGPKDPASLAIVRAIARADVVHCHQYWTSLTALAIVTAAMLGKPVFVTDYGARRSDRVDRFGLEGLVAGFLPISEFSACSLPSGRPKEVIYGGVSEPFLTSDTGNTTRNHVLFVGRILPHKGVEDLIEALPPGMPLVAVGRAYDGRYLAALERMASAKPVRFVTDANDRELLALYRTALVTVLPSVYEDMYGRPHPHAELLGLVLLESMACGTPVICTEVGGMPEIVDDGVTGFIVPPRAPSLLREKIAYLAANRDRAASMGDAGRARVRRDFTWEAVARRCLAAYSGRLTWTGAGTRAGMRGSAPDGATVRS